MLVMLTAKEWDIVQGHIFNGIREYGDEDGLGNRIYNIIKDQTGVN
jgi:hypothetical protein